MGYEIIIMDGNNTLDIDYMSYNFSKFRDIWHVSFMNNKTGKEILLTLKKIRNTLKERGNTGILRLNEEDGWTGNENVFLYHINRLILKCMKYSECKFYVE